MIPQCPLLYRFYDPDGKSGIKLLLSSSFPSLWIEKPCGVHHWECFNARRPRKTASGVSFREKSS